MDTMTQPLQRAPRGLLALGLTLVMAWAQAGESAGQTVLKDICRVKGQEANTLQGVGLVVGLRGSGDGANFAPTIRSLGRMMDLLNQHPESLAELKDAKNVALVTITATVPAAGARQGDQIDCTVSAIAAKSLEGGMLLSTPLVGPDPRNPRVYALAQGRIDLDAAEFPTNGRVHGGCRLEQDFFNVFTKDGRVTLVLDASHADFEIAQEVADQINAQLSFQSPGSPLAKAINQANIEVAIPRQYLEDPVQFVAQILALPIVRIQTPARVVIDERAGTIVIDGDVEIGPVVVSHKNVVIETGAAAAGGRFVALDAGATPAPKLRALVEALNGVRVPTADVIDIIKGLERNGKLHGQLILQ